MTAIDIDHLRGWIGATNEAADIVTPGLVERFAATFAGLLPQGTHAPLGIHWCLAPPAAAGGELGEDGHPRRGGFLPPVPLQRRMWAGGQVTFLEPIEVGDRVTRRSRIGDVAHKSGRSGELVFVTVEHELATTRGIAIRERQDIVYREAATGRAMPGPSPLQSQPQDADVCETVPCDSVMLFRYSALTFNGHRIHYDRAYATGVEHYSGLVVHGPLQATCLMNLAARLLRQTSFSLSYRGVAPLIEAPQFRLNARREEDRCALWTANTDGCTAMTMTVAWP